MLQTVTGCTATGLLTLLVQTSHDRHARPAGSFKPAPPAPPSRPSPPASISPIPQSGRRRNSGREWPRLLGSWARRCHPSPPPVKSWARTGKTATPLLVSSSYATNRANPPPSSPDRRVAHKLDGRKRAYLSLIEEASEELSLYPRPAFPKLDFIEAINNLIAAWEAIKPALASSSSSISTSLL